MLMGVGEIWKKKVSDFNGNGDGEFILINRGSIQAIEMVIINVIFF